VINQIAVKSHPLSVCSLFLLSQFEELPHNPEVDIFGKAIKVKGRIEASITYELRVCFSLSLSLSLCVCLHAHVLSLTNMLQGTHTLARLTTHTLARLTTHTHTHTPTPIPTSTLTHPLLICSAFVFILRVSVGRRSDPQPVAGSAPVLSEAAELQGGCVRQTNPTVHVLVEELSPQYRCRQ
jgi:hypothetical protein